MPNQLARSVLTGALVLAYGFCGHASKAMARSSADSAIYNVRSFGAKGDGKTLDTDAINKAISDAAAHGGGTVDFPAGSYLSFSVHLQSNITLFLDQGATLVAATPDPKHQYDPAEPNAFPYQDFGHSHWHNSLIWGENLQNVSIEGPGQIFGQGLMRGDTGKANDGAGNKAISLEWCRNVTLRDFTIRHGGWFGILATGVDEFTIDNLKIDTNRDGMDIDCCRNVHVSNCTVNSPRDDGICLKSSYGLGVARPTENVTINNCQVSGYEEGTLLDGTFVPARNGTGRIKLGTESNGGFKNITISNCVFIHCCGLALETVDGGGLEDVSITNVTMRDIVNAPIFLRLGRRMRGPAGVPVGDIQRVSISHVDVYNAAEGAIISGIPDHPIQDVRLSDIRIYYNGGGTKDQASIIPPEDETGYPEPNRFGVLPAYGFYIRHVAGIDLDNIELNTESSDGRSPFVLSDVDNADIVLVKAQHAAGVPVLSLQNTPNLRVRMTDDVPDTPPTGH
jgi:polygalacturonase